MALSEARKFSLNPLRLLEFWSPGPWRAPNGNVPIELFSVQEFNTLWSASVFLGAAVLSLAIVAIALSRMRRESRLLAALGTVALVVSLGTGTWAPVYEFLQHALPGWQFLRYPEKTVVFIALSTALLSGLGAQCLFEGFSARKWRALGVFQNRLLFFAAVNIVLLLAIGSGGELDAPLLVMAGAPPEAHAELKALKPAINASLVMGALLALIAWAWMLPARRLSNRANEVLEGLAVVASLIIGTWGPMRMNLGRPASLLAEPAALRDLRAWVGNQPTYGHLRLYTHHEPGEACDSFRETAEKAGLQADCVRSSVLNLTMGVNGLFQLEDAYGFIPLTAQGRGMTAFEELPDQVYFHGFNVRAAQRLADAPTDPEKTFELLFDDRAGDRIRLVQGVPVASTEEAIAVANRPDFDAVNVVPVETGDANFPTEAPRAAKLDVVTYSPEYIDITAASETATTLFIADAFADGWRATIDGEEVPIFPGLIAGRAIAVPAGEHRVELTYRTPGLRVGLVLSAIGWLAIAALAFWGRRRRRDEPSLEALPT